MSRQYTRSRYCASSSKRRLSLHRGTPLVSRQPSDRHRSPPAVTIALIAAGGEPGSPPLADQAPVEVISDPLPQAFALTAIVISFGLTLFLLALARREQQLTGDDLVEDDLEDRRIAVDEVDTDAVDDVHDTEDGADHDRDRDDDDEIVGQLEIDE